MRGAALFYLVILGIFSTYSFHAQAFLPEPCDDPEYTSKHEYAFG